MRRLSRLVYVVAVLTVIVLLGTRLFFGGGRRLEDRSTAPQLSSAALQLVANLDYPPGNIAVSRSGRVFFTLHPDGNPPGQVFELIDGKPTPYPSSAVQKAGAGDVYFQSVLSIRIDAQDRLWVLDYANFGRGQPRLLAFDINNGSLVERYDFPREVAGFLSMVNDFQVDPSGETIYIAETSPILQRPALIVYDVKAQKARRLLEGHYSLAADDFVIQAPGRDMILFGVYTLRIAVDSIALDKRGEWLYYGALSGDRMYRIAAKDLKDESLTSDLLAVKVENYAAKTLSDGLTMDADDNLYVSDMEHSAVHRIGRDRRLTTMIRDSRLRWPDGFSFGPDGWLYVTCSALENVLFVNSSTMRSNAPYQIFRFQPGVAGVPGH